MPRPYWKGHVRLSLVTFAVALYPAIDSSSKLAFHQIERSTGQRVRERKVVPGKEDVTTEDIVKGYEYEKGRYVVLDEEDFEKVRLESKKTIELERFFPVAELDPIYIDKPYYVVPDGALAEEAFAVVREALEHEHRAALGRVVLSGRERPVAIAPRDKGMVLYTLHTADAIRKASLYFGDIKEAEVDEDQVAVAEALVGRKAGHFDPGRFVDRYQEGLRQIIQAKIEGETPPVIEDAHPGNVINLMDALRRSLESEGAGAETGGGGSAPAGEKKKGGGTRKKKAG
ncbi:MAG: Ku protein [Solirubrobacterales bacterium]